MKQYVFSLDKLGRLLAVSALMAMPAHSAVTIISNDFGVGADVGPAFQQISNGTGSGSADTATGAVTASGHADAARGFNTSTALNVTSANYASITAHWVVSGASIVDATNINSFGWFFGLATSNSTAGTGLWSNNNSVGILIYGDESLVRGQPWSLAQRAATDVKSYIGLNGSQPTVASVNDGFTVTLTINSDDTWSALSSGLSTEINTSGSLTSGKFDAIAASLVANTSIQGNPVGYTVDSVTVTGISAIPEPSAALLGGLGVLLLLRRRR